MSVTPQRKTPGATGVNRKHSFGKHLQDSTGFRRPVPGTAQFVELHQRHPGATCWATCELDAHSRETDSRAFLRLPVGHDPAIYSWPVSGREMVLIGTGASDRLILETCRAMLRHGALRIVIIQGQNWQTPHLSVIAAKAVRNAA